jgi:hypothetical protein
VAKAKEAGLTISPALVYKVRGRAESAKLKVKASAPKNASGGNASATAGSGSGGPPMSKAAFIRSQPASARASDVIAAAAKLGMKLTANHVYAVRSSGKPAGRAKAATVSAGSVPGRRGRPPKSDTVSSVESTFRRLVIELGVSNAKRLLSEVEEKLKALVAGA